MILTLAVTVVVAAVAGLSLVLWLVPYPEDGEPTEHAGVGDARGPKRSWQVS